jgi:hypothetical protein
MGAGAGGMAAPLSWGLGGAASSALSCPKYQGLCACHSCCRSSGVISCRAGGRAVSEQGGSHVVQLAGSASTTCVAWRPK